MSSTPARPPSPFYLLENDGHNVPLFWRFASREEAEGFLLGKQEGYEDLVDEAMVPGYFLSDEEWVDPDGTSWTFFEKPELDIVDHTPSTKGGS